MEDKATICDHLVTEPIYDCHGNDSGSAVCHRCGNIFSTGPENNRFSTDQKLLALTWKQPYADMMLVGKIETRTWSTPYRGWVLICAGKTKYEADQVLRISGSKQFNRILETRFQLAAEIKGCTGKAIAIARLIDCRPMRPEDEDSCFVLYRPELYCHVYDRITPIVPFDWRGSQGWTEVSDPIKEQIRSVFSSFVHHK